MRTMMLIESEGARRQLQVETFTSGLEGFVVATWRGKPEHYALTHSRTGRSAHLNPKTIDEIELFVRELSRCRIEPKRIIDGETAEHFFVQRLSPEALEMAQA